MPEYRSELNVPMFEYKSGSTWQYLSGARTTQNSNIKSIVELKDILEPPVLLEK